MKYLSVLLVLLTTTSAMSAETVKMYKEDRKTKYNFPASGFKTCYYNNHEGLDPLIISIVKRNEGTCPNVIIYDLDTGTWKKAP